MPGLLEYYPSEKYIRKGWAGEKVPLESLRALANAQKLAVAKGLLSPKLAEKLLPNTLVEGRFDDYGFNFHDYPPNPQRDAMFKAMGMRFGNPVLPIPPDNLVTDSDLKAWEEDFRKRNRQPMAVAREPEKFGTQENTEPPGYYPLDRTPEAMARFAAIGMAERAKLYGEDKAIERWNGQGPGARNHAAKVDEAYRMLKHPANKALLQMYNQLLGE